MIPNNANTYLPGVIQIPSSLVITAITRAFPAVVTCIVNSVNESNTYIPGQLVRLFIPRTYGMQQIANQTLKILAVNGLNFSLQIDSTQFDPFAIPASGEQPATMAPSGSRNLEYSNNTKDLAFQSLNNQGN